MVDEREPTVYRAHADRASRIRDRDPCLNAHRFEHRTRDQVAHRPAPSIVEVLDDLRCLRPLLRWDDQVDVASPEAIERVIGGAVGVETHVTELVAPGDRGPLVPERGDGLPTVETRVADRDWFFLGRPRRPEPGDPHPPSVRAGRADRRRVANALRVDPRTPGASLPRLRRVTFARGWGLVPSGGVQRDARAAPGYEELRRSVRSTRIAVGTLACDRCDAPVAIGDAALSPGDELTCPYCQRRAPARDFLSLAVPTRPTRVVVRVVAP